jgi:four helix bundle protein
MAVAESVYTLTKPFPPAEMYGMTAQMRRCSVSVAANIAEGHGRETTGSFVQFLRIAQGSLKELETQLILSQRVGLASSAEVERVLAQCTDLGKMLRSLLRTMQNRAVSR